MIDTKNTEPKYVPELIGKFNINGATVTLDALSTQTSVAEAIISNGGYYILAVKNNQPKLYAAVKKLIKKYENGNKKEKLNNGVARNNRIDSRKYVVIPAKDLAQELLDKWPGLKEGCVIKAITQSFRRQKGCNWKIVTETRWFITCHPYGDGSISKWLAKCIRGHWGVESFHWTLDWIWRQDMMQCQYPRYLATRETLAKMAHNILIAIQKLDQKERGLSTPRSETQLVHEVASTLESGLAWLYKLALNKDPCSLL